MKRSFEANTTLYVALFCVYMEFFQPSPIHCEDLRGLANAAVVTENFKRKEKDVIRQTHQDL